MSKCTLQDVAKACNVSAYTVSRAVNDKKDISKETKEKILKVAKEMGYIANSSARNLRTGQTKNIAIIYDDFENPYYNMIIKKMAIKLNDLDYSITIFYDFDSISLFNTKLLKRVLSSNIDGIISFIALTENAKKLNEIWKKPIIQFSKSNDIDVDSIHFDDEDGGYKLTNKVISKGYKNIGFISVTDKIIGIEDRIKGYKKSLKENNIKFNNNYVIKLTDDKISITEATAKLIDMGCDAIICYNDISAYKVLSYLDKHHKNVFVAGFDNIQQSLELPFNLLTVSGNIDDLVDKAIDLLLKRINGYSDKSSEIVLPVSIKETNY